MTQAAHNLPKDPQSTPFIDANEVYISYNHISYIIYTLYIQQYSARHVVHTLLVIKKMYNVPKDHG